MTSEDEPKKSEAKRPARKKTPLKTLQAEIDKDALKVFADAPKMAVTVVSFITSAGAIMFRLSQSAKTPADAVDPSLLQVIVSPLNTILFLMGLLISFWSIILSYQLISSITACFIEITDEKVSQSDQQSTWTNIREIEYPKSEAVMMTAVVIWIFVIFFSAFTF